MAPSDPETPWRVRLRRREPDDEFFHEGNLFSHLASSSKLLSSAEKEDLVWSDEDSRTFACQVASCRETFADLSSYESHYHSRHRNVCVSCKKVLPTSYLLDVHISEEHDPVFALRAHNRVYRCLIESCTETFSDANQRKDHLIHIHKYPSSFRFGRESSNETRRVQQAMDTQPAVSAACDARLSADLDKAMLTEPDGAAENRAAQGRTFAYAGRVPSNISFGHGVQRGFKSSGGISRGRGRAKKACRGSSRPAIESQSTYASSPSPTDKDVHRGWSNPEVLFGSSPEVDLSDVAAALPVE